MSRKIVAIETKPRARADAAGISPEQWIRGASAPGASTKRLTIDIDGETHRRLRVRAAAEQRTMADIVRALIDDACPQ